MTETSSQVNTNGKIKMQEVDDSNSNRSFIFEDDVAIPGAPITSSSRTRNNINIRSNKQHTSAKALSMAFMKSLSGLCCQDCGRDPIKEDEQEEGDDDNNNQPSELYNLQALQRSSSSISHLVSAPMSLIQNNQKLEGIIGEYMCLCQFYKVPYNAGILTTLRFSLPSLRVSGSFHDTDMLALVELFLRHSNTRLKFVTRLDFTMASREGKQHRSLKFGFTSHGALALAKCLQTTQYISQVWLPMHRIGPYGASALFLACSENPSIQALNLRRCRIGERGAFAFCELIGNTTTNNGLQEVDLSSNGIGHSGTVAIERALVRRAKLNANALLFVNLEGNLVFPEIVNGITHGLGVVLSLIGGYVLMDRVKDMSQTHHISCAIFSISLLVLYMSSTLYHSFYALRNTKYVFQVFDKCAIYILIAGSYTPFLQILFADKPIWSIGLLGFIWVCCVLGIMVEAFCPTWRYRPMFSLTMYLFMGWAAMICLPDMSERLPAGCINYLILGGVGYTAGVPFFVRDNNLDHAIWHLFVMSGSIFHWVGIYIYVAQRPLVELVSILTE